jgi:predicted nuclease of predicted toxin-antitoxin system
MQFLLHGSLSPAVAEALKRHEHVTHAIAELGVAAEAATPKEILEASGRKQWDICTPDADLVHSAQIDPGAFKRSIVFLQLEGGDVEQDDAIDRLFTRYPRFTPGRVYTVTASRVKIRQLPKK